MSPQHDLPPVSPDELGAEGEALPGGAIPGGELGVEETPQPGAAETQELAAPSVMSHTAEEMPELQGLQIGDMVQMRVANISDDGVYDLEVFTEEPDEGLGAVAPEEGLGVGGRQSIRESFA